VRRSATTPGFSVPLTAMGEDEAVHAGPTVSDEKASPGA
jgi:hypothetical protein